MPENITRNDLLLIKTGEIAPIDGVIVEGSSNFDISSITGEANPVFMGVGDKVISGSISLSSAVSIEAKVDYKDSTTSRIAKLISDAVSNKSDTEKFITKFSRIYTPVVVALAVLVIAIMTAGALGYATLWEAVIADVRVALITVLNSIKIFKGD